MVLKFNKTQPEKSEQSLFDEHFKGSGITSWMYGQLQMSIFPEGLISSRPLPPGQGLSRSMTMSQGEDVSCCMVLAERALCTGELAVTQLASQPLSNHLWQQILALTEQTLMKIAQVALQHNMTPWDLKLDNLGLFADGTWRVIDFEPFELNENRPSGFRFAKAVERLEKDLRAYLDQVPTEWRVRTGRLMQAVSSLRTRAQDAQWTLDCHKRF